MRSVSEAVEVLAGRVAEWDSPMAHTIKVRDLRIKVGIMYGLLKADKVEQPRIPIMTRRLQNLFAGRFFDGSTIAGCGEEYLERTIEWAQRDGKRIIIAPRHESDLDHTAFRYLMEQRGMEDFCNNTVWISGINMLKRPWTKPWMRGEHMIYLATPSDKKTLQGYEKYFNPAEFRNMQQIMRDLNTVAKERVKEAAKKGKTVVVYPEAGRSYDGWMKRAPGDVSVYFPRDGSAVVFSYRLRGPKQVNPPNEFFRIYKAFPGFRQHITMYAAEPYLSSEVWKWIGKDFSLNPADWVMANIANAHPSRIRPEDLAHYRDILLGFRPERNRIPQINSQLAVSSVLNVVRT